MNVVAVTAAGTVTEVGTGSAVVLLDARVTVLPPAGATGSTVTVHVVAPPVMTLAGAHASDDTTGLIGETVTVAFALPPSAAVTVTV